MHKSLLSVILLLGMTICHAQDSLNTTAYADSIANYAEEPVRELVDGRDYTEADVEQYIRNMYDKIFGGTDYDAVEAEYTSESYKALLEKAEEVANGDIVLDSDHWIDSQDADKPSVNSISVQKTSDEAATAKVNIRIYQNSDDFHVITLMLVFENGKWVVDDFVTEHGGVSYSQKSYLETFITEAETNDSQSSYDEDIDGSETLVAKDTLSEEKQKEEKDDGLNFKDILIYIVVFLGICLYGAGKSGSSSSSFSSWTQMFSSPSFSSPSKPKDEPIHQDTYRPVAYFDVEYRENNQPLTHRATFELHPDATIKDFIRELEKLGRHNVTIVSYRRGNDPRIVLE